MNLRLCKSLFEMLTKLHTDIVHDALDLICTQIINKLKKIISKQNKKFYKSYNTHNKHNNIPC